MTRPVSLKSVARKRENVESALRALSAAQEAFGEAATQALEHLAYPGMNLPTLRNALVGDGNLASQEWLPQCIATTGWGPWEEDEFDQFLIDRGIEPIEAPHGSATGLIVGALGWTGDSLARQIEGRDAGDLRIYTQELFVTGLVLGRDPYEVLEQEPIDEVGFNHPAMQFILNQKFVWPWTAAMPEVHRSDAEGAARVDIDTDWAEESVLRRLGYNARADGPGTQERRRMLTEAYRSDALETFTHEERRRWGPGGSPQRLAALSSFLAWLIDFQGREHPAAQAKWLEDLAWLKRSFFDAPRAPFVWPEPGVGGDVRGSPLAGKRLTPSHQLSAIVGPNPLSRTDAVARLWEYIKKNRLQDRRNMRMVNADEALRPLFGKQQVSMFEMAGILSRHLL